MWSNYMGYWSTVIMGGDTPLDYQGDMIDLCGVDYSTFVDGDYDLTSIRSEIESNYDKLTEFCDNVNYGDPNIAYQVLGVLILESGAKLPDDIADKIYAAAMNDEWAKESAERKVNMYAFISQLTTYDRAGGTPTKVKYEGLFEKIFSNLDN
jgi:hypothetical protein